MFSKDRSRACKYEKPKMRNPSSCSVALGIIVISFECSEEMMCTGVSKPRSSDTSHTRTYYVAAENTSMELCSHGQRPNDRQTGARAVGQAISLR